MAQELARNGSLTLETAYTDNGFRLFVTKQSRYKVFSGSVDCALDTQEIDGRSISDREYEIIERWADRFAEHNDGSVVG